MTWPTAILFIISIGLTIASAYLLRPKIKRSPFDTSTPTLHTKGSFIPLILGIQKTAPIIAKVWNRTTRTVKSGGSSGFLGIGRVEAQKDTHYAESAFHILCNSQGATALLGILVNGKRIDDNFVALYSPSHPAVLQGIATASPSGTSTPASGLGGNIPGQFRIYWGEETQPVDSALSAAMGVSSRWPGVCYVVWDQGQLGPSPVWPEIEYIIENVPATSLITSSPVLTIKKGVSPDPSTPNPFPIKYVSESESDPPSSSQSGAKVRNTGWFGIVSAIPGVFVRGMPFQVGIPLPNILPIEGGAPTRNYRVFKEEWLGGLVTAPNGLQYNTRVYVQESLFFNITVNAFFTYFSLSPDPFTRLNVFNFLTSLEPGILGSININVDTGEAPPISFSSINPAHLLSSLLFDPWPHGRGLDPSHFDIASLDSLALKAASESFSPGVIISSGEELESVISSFMQDLGLFIRLDKDTGLYKFVPIRGSDPLITIPSKVLGSPLPERVINISASQITKKVFIFEDRENLFQEATIEDSSDNIQSKNDFQSIETLPIRLGVLPDSAVLIAQRRISEDIQNPVLFSINVKGEGKNIQPGDVCSIPQSEEPVRIIEVEHQIGEPGATLKGFINSYDSIDTLEELLTLLGPAFSPEADPVVQAFEPSIFFNRQELSIALLRTRKHKNIIGSTITLSYDDISFTPINTEESFFFGGFLISALSESDPYVIEDGPTVFVGETSPDIDKVLDLSSSLEEWRTGKQICIIGEEIFFLRNISSIDANTIQLHGLIRYRLGTGFKQWYGFPSIVLNNPRNHAINDKVFIGELSNINPISEPLLKWNTPSFLRSLPFTTASADVQNIESIQITLRRKHILQFPVTALRQTNRNNNYYKSGEDITVSWGWFNPSGTKKVGAGEMPAGQAISSQETLVGYFNVLFEGSSFGSFEINNLTVPEATITAAQIAANLGGDITVTVFHYTDLRTLPELPPPVEIFIPEIV